MKFFCFWQSHMQRFFFLNFLFFFHLELRRIILTTATINLNYFCGGHSIGFFFALVFFFFLIGIVEYSSNIRALLVYKNLKKILLQFLCMLFSSSYLQQQQWQQERHSLKVLSNNVLLFFYMIMALCILSNRNFYQLFLFSIYFHMLLFEISEIHALILPPIDLMFPKSPDIHDLAKCAKGT